MTRNALIDGNVLPLNKQMNDAIPNYLLPLYAAC